MRSIRQRCADPGSAATDAKPPRIPHCRVVSGCPALSRIEADCRSGVRQPHRRTPARQPPNECGPQVRSPEWRLGERFRGRPPPFAAGRNRTAEEPTLRRIATTGRARLGSSIPPRGVLARMPIRWQERRDVNHKPPETLIASRCGELEMPDYAAAHEVIMLAAFASVGQWEIRRTGPEVADLAANAETAPHFHVQAEAALEYARCRGSARIGTVVIKIAAFAEVGEAAADADPERDCSLGEEIHAN